MSKATTGTRGNGASKSAGSADGASVSQLREIIFGEQMEDYEQRFAALEAKMREDFSTLKTSLDEKIKELKRIGREQKAELSDQSVERMKLADMLEGVAAKLRR